MDETIRQPESYETLYNKAVVLAQAISQKWSQIPKGDMEIWRADDPELSMIYDMSAKEIGGKTGIQVFFESRMKEIENLGEQDRNISIWRLTDDLERLQKRVDDII